MQVARQMFLDAEEQLRGLARLRCRRALRFRRDREVPLGAIFLEGHGGRIALIAIADCGLRIADCGKALVHALLISTYELGRQPFGLASPAAWLKRAGVEVAVADVSRTR